MADYMVGALKIRGKVDRVIEFLNENTAGLSIYFDDDSKLIINFLNSDDYSVFKNSLETTFAASNKASEINGFENNDVAYICFDEIKCRHNFETAYFLKAAQKYGIEFKFHGFDYQREINQVVEIKDGKVIWDDELTFKDYFWYCLYPFKGG